ncbi:cytochrome P450 [Apiospora kogelbergensis]|uniref:cytochrome P450 n=1 Tax=Apiospora kogelbergensis TaxID=1337665 RepID=UPI00312F8B07
MSWALFQTFFSPESWFIPLIQFLLPEPMSRFTRVIRMNWVRDDGPDLHMRLGPAFFIVSPDHIIFACADSRANADFLTDTKKWARFNDAEGKYIKSATGEEWQRHKRIVGPCFNERISEAVWHDTQKQTQGMLDMIFTDPNCEQPSVFRDGRTISLHVFLAAALGLPQEFTTGSREKFAGQELSLQESLGSCVDNIVVTWVGTALGPTLVKFFPRSVQQARKAWEETTKLLQNLLANEEQHPTRHGQTFLTQLARFVRKDTSESKRDPSSGSHANLELERSEVIGDLFTLIRAGHETTASAISISLALLAAHPQYQVWVQEEIDRVLADGANTHDYKTIFPKLKRLQAVMFETERLYHPLVMNLRYTPTESTTCLSGGKLVKLPAQTRLQLNLHVSYCSDAIWGDDTLDWRPDRFIIPYSSEKADWPEYRPQPEGGTFEKLVLPRQHISSFWGAGPRLCVGIKFSQVRGPTFQ